MRLPRAFTHRAGGDLPRKPLRGACRTRRQIDPSHPSPVLWMARTRLAADRPSHPSASADTFSFVVPPTEPSLGPLPICVDQFLQYIFQRFNLLVPAVAEGGHQAVDGTRG
jgi:hypothetical protein